jgi:hypothetical protein
VDCPADVAIGSVERLQRCSAGEFYPLEAELAEFSFFCFANDAAVASNTGVTKSVHSFFSFFLSNYKLPSGDTRTTLIGEAQSILFQNKKNTPRYDLERANYALSKTDF